MLVSDRTLESVGIVAQVTNAILLTAAESRLFCDGEVEPTTSTVEKLVNVSHEYAPDLIVAVGGGSNMDLAKALVAVLSSKVNVEKLFGFDQVRASGTTLVCLPTTAGTGSEVTHSAVLKSSETCKKAAILSQWIRPDAAIVDPNLALTCPPRVTAESGIDALTHAIEAYLVTSFDQFDEDPRQGLAYEGNHPMTDLYAERAIRLVSSNLSRAVEDPEHLASRSAMALAATLAGAAFSSSGVSLAHALEYPIGSAYRCSHGVGNGLVLPEVMRFWCIQRAARLAKIASLLGVPDADRMPEKESAVAAVEAVKELRRTIGLPTCLSEIGGTAEDIDQLAETAMKLPRLLELSPVSPTLEDLKAILKACL